MKLLKFWLLAISVVTGAFGSAKTQKRLPYKFYPEDMHFKAYFSPPFQERQELVGSVKLIKSIPDITPVTKVEKGLLNEDVFALAEKRKAEGVELPRITMWCGESDFILDQSRRMYKHLSDLGYNVSYAESAGSHCWDSWDPALENFLPIITKEWTV
jgi:hypothetical protein